MGQPPQKGLVMNTVKSWEEMDSIEIFALKSKKICQFIRPSRDPIIKKSLVSAFIIVSDRLSYFNAKTELKSKVGIIRTSFPWVIEWANWAKTCLGHAMRCTEMSAVALSQSEASIEAAQPIRSSSFTWLIGSTCTVSLWWALVLKFLRMRMKNTKGHFKKEIIND